eukprot:719235-Pyramimonas_sp.AAC.1
MIGSGKFEIARQQNRVYQAERARIRVWRIVHDRPVPSRTQTSAHTHLNFRSPIHRRNIVQ